MTITKRYPNVLCSNGPMRLIPTLSQETSVNDNDHKDAFGMSGGLTKWH